LNYEDIDIGESLGPNDEERFFAILEKRSRIIRDGFDYWKSRCRPDGMPPRRADIDPFEITAIMPNIVLLDVLNNPRDFRYRVVGTGVVEHLTADWTGHKVSEIPIQGPDGSIFSACNRVVTSKHPLLSRIPYVGPHAEYLSCEDIILPLVDDEGAVEKLLAFVAYINKR
jgi:hypothetical protein